MLTLYLTIKREQEMERLHSIMMDMVGTAALAEEDMWGMFDEHPRIRQQVGKVITIHEVREFQSRWGNPYAAPIRYQAGDQWTISTTSGNLARQALRLAETGQLPVRGRWAWSRMLMRNTIGTIC